MKKIKISPKIYKFIKPLVSISLCLVIFVGAFVGSWCVNKAMTKEYTVNVKVLEIVSDTNEIYFKTSSGHIFSITSDEIFAIDENYLVTFKTNNTPTIEDDKIVKVTREIYVK